MTGLARARPARARRRPRARSASSRDAGVGGEAGVAQQRAERHARLDAAAAAAGAQLAARVDGHVAELAAEPVRPAEQRAVDDDAGADAQLARDVEEVAQAAPGALPELRERAEVGLVLGAQRERAGAEPLAQQVRAPRRRSSRGSARRAGGRRCRPGPGSATTAPAVSSALVLRSAASASSARPASSSSTCSTERSRLSQLHQRLVALGAGQVGGARGEEVDADLQPEPDHAAARSARPEAPGGRPCRAAPARSRAPARTRSARRPGSRPSSCSGRSPARSRRASADRDRRRGAAPRRGCGAAPSAGSPGRCAGRPSPRSRP